MKCKRPLCAACLVLLLLMAAGLYLHPPSRVSYREAAGREVLLTGRVCKKEFKRGGLAPVLILYLKPERLVCKQQDIPFEDNFICVMQEGQREPAIGSTVTVEGVLSEYEQPRVPGQFDARAYYAALGVSARIDGGRLTACDGESSLLGEGLFRCRCRLLEAVGECFDEECAALLAAMLLGDRSALAGETKDLYREAGILHILSISGLHVSLLGMGLYRLLRRLRLPTVFSAVCCGVLLLLYGGLIGMPVSACRAIGMLLIRLLGECIGRTCDMPTSLALCAVLLLCGRPLLLAHAGFWLSFTAVAAICVLRPVFVSGLRMPAGAGRHPREGARPHPQTGAGRHFWEGAGPHAQTETEPCPQTGTRQHPQTGAGPHLLDGSHLLAGWLLRAGYAAAEGFLTGLSVMLFTLPVQLYFYYEVPLYGTVLNLLVLPLLGIVLPVCAAAVLLVFAAPPLASLLAGLTRPVFGFYGKCAALAGRMDGSVWTPGKPRLWQILLFLAVLAAVLFLSGLKMRFRIGLLLGAALMFGVHAHTGMTVTFLDVGQGDCACVELPGGDVWLIDCGSSSVRSVGEYRLIPFLKYRGITELEAVFLSHADSDHVNGVEELLAEERIAVGMLVIPEGQQDAEGFKTVRALAGERGVPVFAIGAGTEWHNGEVRALCLHPGKEDAGDLNGGSEVFLLSCGAFSALFTGDVEGAGEEMLLRAAAGSLPEDLTVLKVSHHGSRNATSEAFLSVVHPRVALISAGQGSRYGHPHKETLERLKQAGARVLRTDECGTITLKIRRGRVVVTRFCE